VRRALELLPRTTLINGYGPTENTTFTACHRIPRDAVFQGSVPIGRPIANTRVCVLDAAMRPCPVGVPGELLIGGDGLALGYHHNAALTLEKFVPDPFRAGSRLYRTGDRVRWLPDGTLEFLGRMDFQVKVRGFRIELGEVEAALASHPSVRDAVVVAREDTPGDKRLVAYLVARNGDALEPSAVRTFLMERLPDHMLPSATVVLPALPLSPNGKVDRKALPKPEGAQNAAGFVAPRTPTEARVAELWAALLKVPRVGAEDDFFELGGDSLLATQLASRLRTALGVEVPLRALMEARTVAALAAEVDARRAAQPAQTPPAAAAAAPIRRVARASVDPAKVGRKTGGSGP